MSCQMSLPGQAHGGAFRLLSAYRFLFLTTSTDYTLADYVPEETFTSSIEYDDSYP